MGQLNPQNQPMVPGPGNVNPGGPIAGVSTPPTGSYPPIGSSPGGNIFGPGASPGSIARQGPATPQPMQPRGAPPDATHGSGRTPFHGTFGPPPPAWGASNPAPHGPAQQGGLMSILPRLLQDPQAILQILMRQG